MVAKREYLARVKSKGFWIATVALPLLMGAWMVIPSLVMTKTRATQSLAIVDTTGRIGDPLVESLDQMSLLGLEQASFEVEKVEDFLDLGTLASCVHLVADDALLRRDCSPYASSYGSEKIDGIEG